MKLIEETIEINQIDYLFKIHIEKRKNSRASIRKNVINIRIPNYLSFKKREKEILKFKNWAINNIREKPERFKPRPLKKYIDGKKIKVGDDMYFISINFKDKKTSSARLDNNNISLSISSNLSLEERNVHISKLISRCIADQRLPDLKNKIEILNDRYFTKNINRVVFKNNNSNWGSCSEKGNINISTRLLFAPDDILKYVCIHELAHLIELNHSDRFWNLVEKAMPEYKEKEKWLKEFGAKCYF